MEEFDFAREDKSEEFREFTKSKQMSEDESRKFDCYKKCIEEALDVTDEYACAFACEVR